MAVSIRVPAETHTTPPNFSYRHRPSSRLSPRLLRRIVPVIVLIILTFEGYRLLTATPSPISTLPSATSSPPPPPLPVLPTPDSTATVTTSTDDTYDLAPPLPHLTHAVIVGCHAIWTGGPTLGEAEDEWVLQSIQTGNHAQDTFVAHIRAGVEEAEKDPNALLIFSGGETRVGVGPRMEGTSYFV